MLTIITINFNGGTNTVALLKSLEQQTDRSFDVIVVDNDSTPEDREILSAYAATSALALDVVFSEHNRGFSGGNNLGIRKALTMKREWILLLNNDTSVAPDFIASLRPLLQEPELIGIPLEEGGRTAYAGRIRWLRTTLSHQHRPVTGTDPCLYAIGGALLVHRDVFQRAGLLDERFFLYFEDAEYSLRARKAGYRVQFAQQPTVHHAVSASTVHLGAPLLLRYHMRNALLFNAVHGPWWVRGILPFWSIFSIVKQLVKLVVLPARRPQARAIAAGIIDFYAHRFGRIAS